VRYAEEVGVAPDEEADLRGDTRDNSRTCTFCIDLDNRLIVLSRELCELYGVGHNPLVLPLEEYRARFFRPDDLLLRGYEVGQSLYLESRVVRDDETIIWIRSSFRAERSPDGTNWANGVVQDVTDLVEARQRFEEKTQGIPPVTGDLADIGFRTDVDRNLVWISPSVAEFTGRSPEDLIGSPARSLIDEADWATLEGHRQVAVGFGGGVVEPRVRMKRADGTNRWVNVRAQATRDERGVLRGVFGRVHDCHNEVTVDHAMQMLSGISLILARSNDEAALLSAICNAAVDHGGYGGASYSRARAGMAGQRVVVASNDDAWTPLEKLGSRELPGEELTASEHRTPTRVVTDLVSQLVDSEWKELALSKDLRSAASLSVIVDGALDGVLVIYATEFDGFDDRAIATLEYLALELGFGLSRLKKAS
jgi:PAS domain S-box-containing protein